MMNEYKMKIEEIKRNMIKYESALKVLETQIEIINNEFQFQKKYNPIEHIKCRLKTPESILKKLEDDNIEYSIENIDKNISDIVGIRIICSFESDVYDLIEILRKSKMIKVIKEKDYIKEPKDSGYRSFHMIVELPVELIDEQVIVKAEIQIRTMAMDLWASLDHKLSYKSDYCTDKILKKLIKMSDELNDIDNQMSNLIRLEKQIELMETQEIVF